MKQHLDIKTDMDSQNSAGSLESAPTSALSGAYSSLASVPDDNDDAAGNDAQTAAVPPPPPPPPPRRPGQISMVPMDKMNKNLNTTLLSSDQDRDIGINDNDSRGRDKFSFDPPSLDTDFNDPMSGVSSPANPASPASSILSQDSFSARNVPKLKRILTPLSPKGLKLYASEKFQSGSIAGAVITIVITLLGAGMLALLSFKLSFSFFRCCSVFSIFLYFLLFFFFSFIFVWCFVYS